MKKICKVTVNDEPFLANCGDLLLDWALMNGVDLPHDCRAGICGACKVRLVDGTWRCTCPWWGKHGDDRGPCKHILATVIASTTV